MKRLLIVGCGGSGGAALAYMMDQLRSDLAGHGVDRLPAGWQFVHLDVPTSPSRPDGVGSVRDQGGTYIGTGPESDNYKVLDNALSQRLAANNALDTVATWAPREPETVYTPLSKGAGQYRALGRMITLSRIGRVREALEGAWETLSHTATISEMKSMSIPGAGTFDPDETPIVMVVSSMAGGAGASMALDICRVLTLIPGIDPNLIGVFMVSPDIFEALPPSAVTGTRANALAMLGEIVASQTGAARESDVALMRALGYERGEGERIPFKRVFPVGRYVGAQRTVFGDGTPTAVYRGLGRGLAGLIMSGPALQQFVEWDLGNAIGDQGSLEYLGWGNRQWDNVPWGTFGYASLSMGRERYAEYAAQRLARTSADRLLRGHLQPGNDASDEEQVNAALDNQWDNICRGLGLPVSSDAALAGVGQWIGMTVLPQDQVAQHAHGIVNATVRPRIDQTPGVNAEHWASSVQRVLAEQRENVKAGAAQSAYSVAYHWQQNFAHALEQATMHSLATLGMPYATGMVKRVSRVLRDVILPETQRLAAYAPADVMEPPTEVKGLLAAKGTLANPAAPSEQVFAGLRTNVERQLYASLSAQIAAAAGALVPEVIDPLINALNESQVALRQSVAAPRRETGLAHLQTDEYAAWPADSDERVAQRFSEADNEVMLTRSSEFKQRYEIDLPGSVAVVGVDPRSVQIAAQRASGHIITGNWPTVSGLRAPGEIQPVVERTSSWVSRAFPQHPDTHETLIAAPAAYDVHTRPGEILARAREFVARKGESFERFCSVSLRDYVTGGDAQVAETELAERRRDLLLRFGEAVSLARPLASVNENVMQAIHGVAEMVYRYKFSSVPLRSLAVADELAGSLGQTMRVDTHSVGAFESALSDERNIKRIDIFGSYPNYSPLAYNAVVDPAARQWLAASPAERAAFWTYRRSRPLQASLPMHDAERRAMVGGWILGRAIGFIRVPESPYAEAAQVWDSENREWLSFPNPLLTPPANFLADYDWLPAVLESVLVAMAQSHQPPVMGSMRPYRALRRVFDAGKENPTTGPTARTDIAARVNMSAWLATGDSGTGWPSVISGTGPEATIDERAERITAYFSEYQQFVATHYMKPGEGGGDGLAPAPGGGTFATIGVRAQASKTPFFRDLAPDVYWATNELKSLVAGAVEGAKRPSGPAHGIITPTVGEDDWSAPQMGGSGNNLGGML